MEVQEAFIACASSHVAPLSETKKALKKLFASLMTAEEIQFVPALTALVKRYKGGQVEEEEAQLADLVIRLHNQFPGDVGVFCSFVLNYVKLEKGEALFLGAGEPHAYLSGGECRRQKKKGMI